MSCVEEAAASVQFDAERARVLLIDVVEPTVGIPVCRVHVETRTAPMGWTLHDHRTVMQPSLWPGAVPESA